MRTRKRDLLGFGFFGLFWLMPVAYNGFFGRALPGWPLRLQHLTNISCLFTHKILRWPIDYVQVQKTVDGPWETLPMRDYFTVMPFGYRTRMNEMLNRKLGARSVLELSAFFRERHRELHPREPGIHAVRFLSTFYYVGMGVPPGRWVEPALESFPESDRLVWFTRVFAPPPRPRPSPQ